jgi:RNA polymerase sigma-70 factor (ECF subfamily)
MGDEVMTTAAVVSLATVALPIEAVVLPFRARVATRDAGVPVGRAEPYAPHAVERRAAGTVEDIDYALVRAVARGSKSAMRTLFIRHQIRVYRVIKRIVRDHAEAEDLTSEVFLAVWRRADLFQGRSRVSTWLCGIARHKALTALETVPPICHDEEAMLTVSDPAPSPEGHLYAQQRTAALRGAITALSREHREIIDLVYYRGKSIKEIADMLGIGLNTVKTRMFYARKRLAGLIAAAGV